MSMRGIAALGDLEGKRVLLRADFNVPLRDGADGAQEVADDYRLESTLPTIRRLCAAGARVVACSHLGDPKGPEAALSLRPVAARLGELLGQEVAFCPETTGPAAEAAAAALAPGGVLVIENLRFHKGEKKDDPAFAAELARLGDVYVNDAFGVCHRPHASVSAITKLLPSAAGELVEREVAALRPLREGTAERPFVVVLGGSKLGTKIPVLQALIPLTDAILVGGGMAYTLLKAMGKPIGGSRCEDDLLGTATQILETARTRARETGQELVLPRDHVVAKGIHDLTGFDVVEEVPSDRMALDVGPETLAEFVRVLRGARTVFWNGPLGVFETPPFHLGTHYIASFLAGRHGDVKTVVGGGDSAAAARELGVADRMDWVSTGGGASLLYVQGDPLPGLEALPD
ncbi:MAG: phosphoglycerate kinase [Planctomycetota bacterium]